MAVLYVPNIKPPDPANIGSGSVIYGTGAPTAAALPGTLYIATSSGNQYFTVNGTTWTLLSSGGGGGGTSNLSQGTSNPVSPPADPTNTGFYTNTTSGVIWTWDKNAQAWI